MANMATKDDFEGLNAIIRDCTAKLEAAGEDAVLHCQAFAEMQVELADYARRLGPRKS